MMIFNWIVELIARLPLLLFCGAVLFAARRVFEWHFRIQTKDVLCPHPNGAVAFVLSCFLLAVAWPFAGCLSMHSEYLDWKTFFKIAIEGNLVILLVGLSVLINDRFVLHGFDIRKEILEDKNMGTAYCVGGSMLATGAVLNGACIGYSQGFIHALIDMTAFWAFGQCMLYLAAVIYRKIKTYDIHRLIEFDDNAAAGLGFGSMLLSMGIIVRASVIGAGSGDLLTEWVLSVTLSLIGLIALLATYFLITRWIVSNADLQDEIEMKRNTALATVLSGSTLAIAVFVSTLIQR